MDGRTISPSFTKHNTVAIIVYWASKQGTYNQVCAKTKDCRTLYNIKKWKRGNWLFELSMSYEFVIFLGPDELIWCMMLCILQNMVEVVCVIRGY